jgi:CO/xanthine dehydrogenase Mo-binding subunit
MNAPGLDRRRFLELAGGGIAVFFSVGPSALFAQEHGGGPSAPDDPNSYLLIGKDGRVTVFSGKIEMGQGVMTSLAQMAAEELGVPLSSIDMVLGDTDRCPYDRGTFGSQTTRMFGPSLRAAAAEARLVLLGLAAKKLGAPRDALTVKDGVVSVASDPSRRATYGELAQGRKIARLVGEKAVLRAAKDFEVMGRSPRRLDGRDKVTGAAKYAADIHPAGLLYARILRPPAHGATLKSVETAEAKKKGGVVVVEKDDLVAVLHADPDGAESALAAVRAQWNPPGRAEDPETIFDHILKHETAPEVKESRGDVAAGRAASAHVLETTYRKGYVAHAPMEPHAAIAEPKDGRFTVWASTQTPFPTRERIAKALGVDEAKVRVITPYVGGGFGGKSADLQAIEAARLAQATGKPVQVAWTRAEEFFFDRFDPAAVVEMSSGVDASGKIAFWDCTIHAAGERSALPRYDIANLRLRSSGRMSYGDGRGPSVHPFATGPWRAPGANMNVFATESHVDAMAVAAHVDPLEFRLRNTNDPRLKRVLEAVAKAYGWKPGVGPTGAGRGLACSTDAGAYDALVAEVRVDPKTGEVRVERIVCAQEMGTIVNPEGARMQMEGAITMGLGYTLVEELRFRGGEVLDKNFDTYPLARFSRLPRIEAILVPNDELAPQGGGEPGIVPSGAAIANAVFDATGARMTRLPLTRERVKKAVEAAGRGAAQLKV